MVLPNSHFRAYSIMLSHHRPTPLQSDRAVDVQSGCFERERIREYVQVLRQIDRSQGCQIERCSLSHCNRNLPLSLSLSLTLPSPAWLAIDMFRVLNISDSSLSNTQQALYAQSYTDLRITALERSPHAFSTTVEVESQLKIEQRLARLREPQKTIFVCVNDDDDDWVGQITLIGPLKRSEYDASFRILPDTESAQSPSLDDDPAGATGT